jgi:hypothetical protein
MKRSLRYLIGFNLATKDKVKGKVLDFSWSFPKKQSFK